MQDVSQAYKDSMKSNLRERGYITIMFGLVNQELQGSTHVASNNLTDYSLESGVFGSLSDRNTYGTLEKDFTPATGTMYLLPDNYVDPSLLIPTGLTSQALVTDNNPITIVFDFNLEEPVDYKGLTLNFGSNYPTSMDIISGNQSFEVRDNDEQIWTTDVVFENATSLTITVYQMLKPQTRLRIYNVKFGYGLVFDNNDIIESTLTSDVSPISERIPQFDFSVRLMNFDKYFNVDNPTSAVNFLETGQEIKISYGYQLPDTDEIEWLDGGVLYCSDWSSDDQSATINAQDIFRGMDGEYTKGMVDTVSFYTLAERVFIDAGISDYEIDNSLRSMYTSNPIPRVPHKQALQLIANATRCVLTVDRSGMIRIVPHTEMYGEPVDFRMERTDMLSYPNALKQELVKDVIVPRYIYQTNEEESSIMSEDRTVVAGQVETFIVSDASYGYRATLTEEHEGSGDEDPPEPTIIDVWVIASGAYYVTVKFLVSGTYKFDLYGHKYQITQQNYRVALHAHGKTMTWDNPLVSDPTIASNLVNWLAEYYASDIEYEYDTRGNPELDTSDVIYQDNDFIDDMKVILYRQTLGFNGGFSGKATVRREGTP